MELVADRLVVVMDDEGSHLSGGGELVWMGIDGWPRDGRAPTPGCLAPSATVMMKRIT